MTKLLQLDGDEFCRATPLVLRPDNDHNDENDDDDDDEDPDDLAHCCTLFICYLD